MATRELSERRGDRDRQRRDALRPRIRRAGPAIYALELLPLYDAVARVKSRAHWQSDVLAGFALGTALGAYAHSRASALSVEVLPRGITVGWHTRF